MKRKLRIARHAGRDLDEIWSFSASKWGRSRADAYLREIASIFDLLCDNSGLSRNADHVRPGLRKYPIGSHMVYLRVYTESIRIVRVLHGKMNVEDHL